MSLCSFAALRTDAQALLALINKLPQREWEKRLHGIFVRDAVQGPLAVAWMLQQMLKASTRQDAPFWRGQIDKCKHAARVGHKVRCGLGGLSPSVLSPVAYSALCKRALCVASECL